MLHLTKLMLKDTLLPMMTQQMSDEWFIFLYASSVVYFLCALTQRNPMQWSIVWIVLYSQEF